MAGPGTTTEVASTKVKVLYPFTFKKAEHWAPDPDAPDFCLIRLMKTTLTTGGLVYKIEILNENKEVENVLLNKVKQYLIRSTTWHEVTDKNKTFGLHFSKSHRDFESFSIQLEISLKNVNKFPKVKGPKMDDGKFLSDLKLFTNVKRLKSTGGLRSWFSFSKNDDVANRVCKPDRPLPIPPSDDELERFSSIPRHHPPLPGDDNYFYVSREIAPPPSDAPPKKKNPLTGNKLPPPSTGNKPPPPSTGNKPTSLSRKFPSDGSKQEDDDSSPLQDRAHTLPDRTNQSPLANGNSRPPLPNRNRTLLADHKDSIPSSNESESSIPSGSIPPPPADAPPRFDKKSTSHIPDSPGFINNNCSPPEKKKQNSKINPPKPNKIMLPKQSSITEEDNNVFADTQAPDGVYYAIRKVPAPTPIRIAPVPPAPKPATLSEPQKILHDIPPTSKPTTLSEPQKVPHDSDYDEDDDDYLDPKLYLVGLHNWTCSKCTLRNKDRDYQCAVCQCHREDAWLCLKCHHMHNLDVTVCKKCQVWRCCACTYQNEERIAQSACKECDTRRF